MDVLPRQQTEVPSPPHPAAQVAAFLPRLVSGDPGRLAALGLRPPARQLQAASGRPPGPGSGQPSPRCSGCRNSAPRAGCPQMQGHAPAGHCSRSRPLGTPPGRRFWGRVRPRAVSNTGTLGRQVRAVAAEGWDLHPGGTVISKGPRAHSFCSSSRALPPSGMGTASWPLTNERGHADRRPSLLPCNSAEPWAPSTSSRALGSRPAWEGCGWERPARGRTTMTPPWPTLSLVWPRGTPGTPHRPKLGAAGSVEGPPVRTCEDQVSRRGRGPEPVSKGPTQRSAWAGCGSTPSSITVVVVTFVRLAVWTPGFPSNPVSSPGTGNGHCVLGPAGGKRQAVAENLTEGNFTRKCPHSAQSSI